MKNNNRKQKAKIVSVVAGAMLLATTIIPFSASASGLDTANSNATVGFTPGILQLVSVPDIHFGMQTIPTQSIEFPSENGISGVVVSDARGTNTGWQLQASLAPFTESGSPSLNGSAIFLSNGQPNPLNGTQGQMPSMPQMIALTSDNNAAIVLDASADSGSGTFLGEWHGENIMLKVSPDPSVRVGNHTSQITWTLNDTP